MPPPYTGPLAATRNQSPINDPSRPPSAPIGNQRRFDPMLPGGFIPSPSDPRSHASDPPMVRMQNDGTFLPARNASLHDSVQSLPPMGGGLGGLPGPVIGGLPQMYPGMGPGFPPPGMVPGPGMIGVPLPGAFTPPRVSSNPPGPPGPPGSPSPPMNNMPMRAPPPGTPFGGFPPGQGTPPHFSPFPPQAQGPSRGPSPAPPMMAGPPGPPGPPHMRKSPSIRSVSASPSNGYPPADEGMPMPPLPPFPPPGNFGPPPIFPPPNGFGSPIYGSGQAFSSRSSIGSGMTRMSTPHRGPGGPMSEDDFSPPGSPVHTGPVTSTISAQMRCKVFLKQQHQQWKNLGSAKLKLYHQSPTNVKQLVVEADTKEKGMLISTIVLSDGVERVGKTGVAIELSDQGARTGIVYMIQLRNETSASGLFDSLLAGSDRTVAVAKRQG